MKASHLKEYEEETKTPTGYTKPYNPSSALHQVRSRRHPGHLNAETEEDEEAMADKLEKDPEYSSSKSIVEPYAIRDNAWNFREHDATDFYTYKSEAPAGYNEHIDYDEPHQTNMPYVKPTEKKNKLCEQKA
jgi:hypothetical protein